MGGGADEAGAVGPHDGLGPIPDVELAQDALDVGLHRLGGRPELGGDLGVGQALGQRVAAGGCG